MQNLNQLQKVNRQNNLFRAYCLFNIVRYLGIGVLILFANLNAKANNKYCCSCYYISLNPSNYTNDENINSNTKFDLSDCIPECTDCTYCRTRFNNSATAAFNYANDPPNSVCPYNDYTDDLGWFDFDWNKHTGCNDQIHLTVFHVFAKSYTSYGIWSIIFALLYSVILLTFMCLQATDSRFMVAVGQLSYVVAGYNLFFSAISLYFIYVPFEYYQHNFNQNTNDISIKCEISLIDSTIEWMITILIYVGCFLFVLQLVYSMYHCCRCCWKCKRKVTELEEDILVKQVSIGSEPDIKTNQSNMTDNSEQRSTHKWSISTSNSMKLKSTRYTILCVIGSIVVFLAIVYLGILLDAMWIMLNVHKHGTGYMISVVVLLLSTLDIGFWKLCMCCKTECIYPPDQL